MTEAATPKEAARDAFLIAADTMGHDLLAALLGELRSMPDHWARLNEQLQQRTLDNLKGKIRATVENIVAMLMRGEFAAVQAELKTVAWGSNINATIAVARDALYRHALSDAQGQKVLVVLTDASRWTQRMDEIKAKADQLELWSGDYDPSVDQPGYRRDQDRTATGPTWADLKKSLGMEGKPPGDAPGDAPAADPPADAGGPEATPPHEGPVPGEDANLSDHERQVIEHRMLQEKLASIGVGLSLGAIQALTPEQITAAREWVEAYAADPDSCKIEKPSWLPPTEPGAQT